VIANLAVHYRRQAVHLINHDEVLKHARCKEECVALLQRHGAAEFRFVVVITQVCYLIQVTTHKHKYKYSHNYDIQYDTMF